jgi:hypothetical protein
MKLSGLYKGKQKVARASDVDRVKRQLAKRIKYEVDKARGKQLECERMRAKAGWETGKRQYGKEEEDKEHEEYGEEEDEEARLGGFSAQAHTGSYHQENGLHR